MACAARAERTNGPAIWTPASASPDLTTLRRLIPRGSALDIFSSLTPTASLADLPVLTLQPLLDPAPYGWSGRPGHLAAALLDRTCDRSAVDHVNHMKEIVRRRSTRLGVAHEERGEQLVLAGAIESRVRPKRDLGRQMEVLQSLRHVDRFQRIRLGGGECAGPD